MRLLTILPLMLLPLVALYSAEEFNGSFDLVASQKYPSGSERSNTISYHFGTDKTAIIIPSRGSDPEFRLVFDPDEMTITGLFEMRGTKGGYILPMNEQQWPGMSRALRKFSSNPSDDLNYTGEQKEIEGYVCRELLAENDAYSARMWVATEIPLSMTRVLSYQSVGKGKAKEEAALFDEFAVDGLPLELFLKSKQGKADVTVRLINVKKTVDPSVFNSEGYSLAQPNQ